MTNEQNIICNLSLKQVIDICDKFNLPTNQIVAGLDPNFRKKMCDTNNCPHKKAKKSTKDESEWLEETQEFSCEKCCEQWLQEEYKE